MYLSLYAYHRRVVHLRSKQCQISKRIYKTYAIFYEYIPIHVTKLVVIIEMDGVVYDCKKLFAILLQGIYYKRPNHAQGVQHKLYRKKGTLL